jgi:acetylornithine aminotransferase/acetylornithine/N-succinyldiaminopimelate aminotransferase
MPDDGHPPPGAPSMASRGFFSSQTRRMHRQFAALMKEIVPAAPAVVRNEHAEAKSLFQQHVVPSYGRFDLTLSHGAGSLVWDVSGRRYIDLGGGIAVCSLGHAHPEVTEALVEQSRRLVHVSNLYFTSQQGQLARTITRHLAPGRVFFCNSGAEANEGLFKLARRFGHDEGRFEILTAINSFHGRTLAAIAATGQDKVKQGFGPATPGFRHVPFNDLKAVEDAISPATVAVLIEGIQGEGGITPASPAYLAGLRRLCDERRLLLLIDAVQCGHFRSGRYQSFQRILEGTPGMEGFEPDGVSMAKSMGGGFPIGAFWVREKAHGMELGTILGPGSHGTTYGGTPLGCAVASRIFHVIERDGLEARVREEGDWMARTLARWVLEMPEVVRAARGLGFMQGIELRPREEIPALASVDRPASLQLVQRLHDAGVLTIPSGNHVVRFLPALNMGRPLLEEAMATVEGVLRTLQA